MTIKELEARTGMVRANIRYYEEEGLLSPRRLENGYRDYSEEDVRTLEKIKLLRSLQLDIGTIRQLQRGTLTLEQAMFNQLTRLEGDRAGWSGRPGCAGPSRTPGWSTPPWSRSPCCGSWPPPGAPTVRLRPRPEAA